MIELLMEGKAHSITIVVFYLLANLGLTTLNFIWASTLIKKFVGGGSKGGKKGSKKQD